MRPLTFLPLALVLLLSGCCATGDRAAGDHASDAGPRVARVWRGRVPAARGDEYDAYLREGISKFPTIPRNRGVQMFRRELADGTTEFVVISYWDSRDDIRAYAGEDIEKVRDLPRDHEFLIEREPTVRHYDIREAVWVPRGE